MEGKGRGEYREGGERNGSGRTRREGGVSEGEGRGERKGREDIIIGWPSISMSVNTSTIFVQ